MTKLRLVIFLFVFMRSLIASAEPCPKGEVWYKAHVRRGYVKANGDRYSSANVAGHCRRQSKAAEYWTERLRDMPAEGRLKSRAKFKPWTGTELEKTLRALEKIPEWLWDDVDIHRVRNSDVKENPASAVGKSIILYDKAFQNPDLLPRVIAHELAHHKYHNFDQFHESAYRNAAKWVTRKKSGGQLFLKRSHIVVSDGDLSPEEDFANNLEYFLFEPVRLKIKDPTLFDWFQLEYGDKIKK